jgi:hypothetical protein
MYSVRIDKDGDGYVFRVQPCDGSLELVALDSAPGIIAMVHANNPAQACQVAWHKAEHMHDKQPEQLPSPIGEVLAGLFKP